MTSENKKIYYVDGQFVEADKAVIPVDDLAVLRGYGVCDIMRTFNGQPFLIKEHIDRLIHSAEGIGLKIKWTRNELIRIVTATLDKNQLGDDAKGKKEVNLRIVVTGGSSPDFIHPQGSPRLIILVTDMTPLPGEWYSKGIKVITIHQERSLPDAKVISYIPASMALKEAKNRGASEAIYISQDGLALEATTSNLFVLNKGRLITPKDKVLNGITRQAVLSLSQSICEVKEDAIPLDTLLNADEIFITGTNKGVVPVVQVDDTVIGSGKPGITTQKIMTALENHSRQFTENQS